MIVRRAPAGYSLLELLVAVAIIGVLLTLTTAAAQKVRAAALRTERANWHHQRALGAAVPRKLPIKVLFVGNSFTFTNDVPGLTLALARGAGAKPELVVDSHVVGGATLERHWNDGAALAKIRSTDWDLVVLQEQSQRPLKAFGRDTGFYPYARKFAEAIRATGAIPLFFMTWARPDMAPAPQQLWTESYSDITKELTAECAPVGVAFERFKQAFPGTALTTDGNGHPSPHGAYLAACTFYAALYRNSPEGLPNRLDTGSATVTISPAEAAAMQRAAWGAWKQIEARTRADWKP
jgi:prepilin-type N-terminal cleavage/methylation domain-containing protein